MKTLKLTQNLGFLNIALNRPDKRNAFQPEMIGELTQVFAESGANSKLRGILLTGEGETFCAGGDLQWMQSMAKFSKEENLKDAQALFDMFNTIRLCPHPIVGKIHGHAMGGGLGLVALCDFVAAEEKTVFCFSEVKWGLVPSVISPFVREKMARRFADAYMLNAKVFNAEEALRANLVHFTGGIAEVDNYVEATLKLLIQAAPGAVRDTKKLLLAQSSVNWTQMRELTTQVIAERRVSVEGQIGLQAFLDKKNPGWSAVEYGKAPKV